MYPDDRESIYPQYSYDDESEYVVVYFKNRQYNWNEDGWGIDQKDVVDSILAQAPYVEGAIRMTLINGQYWPNTQYLMEVATSGTHTAQTKWSPAQWVGDDDITHGPRIVLTNQVFIWYTSGPEGWGQNYEPIRRASWSEMYDIFRNDTNTFARSLAPWCAGARLVCTLGTNSFEAPSYTKMIEILYEVVAEFNQEFAEDTFYVVPDHYIGEIAEHEVLDGHVSPYLNLWRWLMVYNTDGVCHPTEVEERGLVPGHGCPEAVSMTDSFYGSTIYDDCDGCQCEEYNDYGGWQLNWQCSNERYTPVGVHDQPVSFEQRLAAPASAAQECISGSELIDAVQSASGALDGENDHGEESVESIYWWSRCARYEKTGRLWSREGGDRGGVQWTLAICSLLLGGTAVGLSLKNAKLAAAKMVGSSKNENAIVAVNVAPEVTIVPPEPESGLAEKPELDVQGRSSPIAFAVQMVPMVSVQDEGSDATTTPPGAGVPLTPSKLNEPPTELGNPIPPPTPPPGAEVEVVASAASLDGAARYSGHKSERLEALTGARVIASTHIVFGHLYAKGAIESAYLFGWGYTWVPWFFVLSGYALTHARLSSKSPEKVESPLVFFHKRTATIYPLYALGVLLMLGVRVGLGSELPGWGPLVAQAFLMQSFSPRLTEQVLQIHCWFLSTMVPYWFAFGPIYKRARRLSLERVVSMLCALAALPWLSLIVPAMAGPELKPVWWTGHVTGDLCEDSDVWIVFFKFHPISYAHVFIFGVVLAVLRARLAEYNGTAAGGPTPPLALAIRRVIRWGASIGYVGLLLVFCEPSVRPTARKLSARLSILMPLQGLVLIGLSPLPATKQTAEFIGATGVMPIDPLARLFARAPAWLGDVSYAQYVFHMLAYYIWPAKHVGAPLAWLCFEVGGAMFAAVVIMKPAATAWIGGGDKARKDQKSRAASKPRLATVLLGMPSLVALTLVIAKAAYTPRVHVVKETVIPDTFGSRRRLSTCGSTGRRFRSMLTKACS